MHDARRAVRVAGPIVLLGLASLALSAGLEPRAPAASPGVVVRAPPPEPTPDALEGGDPGLGHAVSIEDPSGHALDALHAALGRASRGEGTARLVFYGGSHTASDLYTGRLRALLQERFGDAGHGFVPMAPVVRDHWVWGMRIDEAEGFETLQVERKRRSVDRYGLAGVAFRAEARDAFAAVGSDSWGNGREASRLTLLYDRRPGGGRFEVWLDGRMVELVDTRVELAAAGTRTYPVSDGPHRLEVRVRGDGPVVVYGVLFDRDRAGVVVENLGLVGAKARHQLYWAEDQWRALFVARRPDLVALAYGNNELDDDQVTMEQHEVHLARVVARLRDAAPRASCLLVGPTDRAVRGPGGALSVHPRTEAMSAMQRRVALAHGCAFFDTLAFQGGPGAALEWLAHDPPYMRGDLTHLTRDAYVRWGDVLAQAILAAYEE